MAKTVQKSLTLSIVRSAECCRRHKRERGAKLQREESPTSPRVDSGDRRPRSDKSIGEDERTRVSQAQTVACSQSKDRV